MDKAPDTEPGNLAAIIFKLEREVNETPRKDSRQPGDSWKLQSKGMRNGSNSHGFPSRSSVATAAALPSSHPSNSRMNGPAKRQRKRFDELDEDQQSSIVKVQTRLANKPLGAKLTQEERTSA